MPLELSANIPAEVRDALKGPPGCVWFGLERADANGAQWERVEVPEWGKNSKYWPIDEGVLEVAARIGAGVYQPQWTRTDKRSRLGTGPCFVLAPDGSAAIVAAEDVYAGIEDEDEDDVDDQEAGELAASSPAPVVPPAIRAPAPPRASRRQAPAASTIDAFLPVDRDHPLAQMAAIQTMLGMFYENQLRLQRETLLDAQQREAERTRLYLELERERSRTQAEFFTTIIRATQGRDESSALASALAPVMQRLDELAADADADADDEEADPVELAKRFAAEMQGPDTLTKLVGVLNSPAGAVISKGIEQWLASRGVALPPPASDDRPSE